MTRDGTRSSKVVRRIFRAWTYDISRWTIPSRGQVTATKTLLPDYVAVAHEVADQSLDLVLVDGAYRQPCISAVLMKIRPGGLLVVDDTDWLPIEHWGVPSNWKCCRQSTNIVTQTTVWTSSTSR
jgi:predicted O-methyltransferase YrrM